MVTQDETTEPPLITQSRTRWLIFAVMPFLLALAGLAFLETYSVALAGNWLVAPILFVCGLGLCCVSLYGASTARKGCFGLEISDSAVTLKIRPWNREQVFPFQDVIGIRLIGSGSTGFIIDSRNPATGRDRIAHFKLKFDVTTQDIVAEIERRRQKHHDIDRGL